MFIDLARRGLLIAYATIDNPVESWRMYLLRIEPHSTFFVSSKLTVLKKVKKCWNFRD